MLISREMVLDMDIGLNAALFGGDMMARMDKVAGIAASLLSRNRRFLTLKVSELVFHSPVRAGEIIEFYVGISRQGRTSLTLQIEVQVYEPVSDRRRDVTSGEFVMVAVDESLHPILIQWKPEMVQVAAQAHADRHPG
ncbi:acyl-CoA thioesterase [Geothrix limicola]|uniref:Acyl-CoA thioesterase n=1 Tax=Geothrix limicola TaxID=2927978 RepID=A0ABQ5QBY8_9BACT|nr:hotdog domain-containing protein [Geothrix limicola]GLH72207.1 acyl-CoA thioesterase [Geothrix limicola]